LTKRKRWTHEMVIEEIKRIYENGEPLSPRYVNRKHGGLYRQAFNRFGSWRNAVEEVLGVNYDSVLECTKWTKDTVIKAIQERYENGLSLTASAVVSENKKLYDAACYHIGSWGKAIELSGYNYDEILEEGNSSRSINCTKCSAEDLLKFIRDRYENGKRLSSGYMQRNFNRMVKVADYRFGGWKQAIEAAGIDYNEVREDAAVNKAGHLFEEVLGEILTDLNIKYTKYDHELWSPDFVINNQYWIDAKLSEWTSSIPDTIAKYSPHVDRLDIVYLRGRRIKQTISDKVRILSVYMLLDDINEYKREYYNVKLTEIERITNENKPRATAV
jgi:hypothetical protein